MDTKTSAEQVRLRTLDEYGSDPFPEGTFDRLTRIAARMLGAPMALISMVGSTHVTYQSRFGIELRRTERSLSFCSFALGSRDVLVVPDTTLDGRFASNPLVTGEPNVRFYAGAPLVTPDGQILGTLCILDPQVRRGFNLDDRQALTDLAALVVDELELRRSRQEARREARENQQRTIDLQDALSLSHLLGDLSNLVDLDLPPEDLLPHAVELVSSALEVDWGGLMALQGEMGTLLSHWHRAPAGPFVTTLGHQVRRESGGLLWQAAQQAEPLFVNDYAAQAGGRRDLQDAGGRAVVSAQLGQNGPVTFVMTLVRLSHDRPWNLRDRQLVQAALGVVRQSVVRAAAHAALRESEARLQLALHAAPVVLWATDLAGTFTLSEGRGLTELGSAPGQSVGRSVEELYAQNADVRANVARALAGESFTTQVQAGQRFFEAWYGPLRDLQGQQVGAVGTGYDVTETIRAQREAVMAREEAESARQAAVRAQEQSDALLDLSQVLETDMDASTPEIAQAALTALGRVMEGGWLTLWQRQGDTFFPVAQHGEVIPAVRERQAQGIPASRYEAYGVLAGARVFLAPEDLPQDALADGLRGAALLPVFREVPGWEMVLAAYRGDVFKGWSLFEQHTLAAAARILGVTAQRRMQFRQMELAATTDLLTGLGNRRAFEVDVPAELRRAERQGKRVGLLSLDLDGLKRVNDLEGHVRGDALLREFARQLQQGLREQDRAYRLGGDEFMVVLPGVGEMRSAAIEARVRAVVAATRAAGFGNADVSMGLACFPAEGHDAETLLQLSDARMYANKAEKSTRSATRDEAR
jgi:diguanylate cyclase (GGDEF)-like protein/PAS domain S-box-containing protein